MILKIKLKENFFNDDSIVWLEKQQNGHIYINLYLKLLLKTMNTKGQLAFHIGNNLIPMNVEDIAAITRIDVDTVIVAMSLFKQLGLVKESEEIASIPSVNEMIGSESAAAQRMRKLRAKKDCKLLEEKA